VQLLCLIGCLIDLEVVIVALVVLDCGKIEQDKLNFILILVVAFLLLP
jgi:hypothetical protein